MVREFAGIQEASPEEDRGEQVFDIAMRHSKWMSISQFGVALFGGWLHLLADTIALAFYTDMWNEIRDVYGKGTITAEAAKVYLWPNLSFIIGDLVLDKGLGMIPLAGSVFCYMFTRALTFRLAALFGVLAALDEETPEPVVVEVVSNLIQELYPRRSFLFTLADPDKATFVELLASIEGLKGAEAKTRVQTAINVLRGKHKVRVVEDEGDFDVDAELVESLEQYGMVLWQGADSNATEEADITGEDIQMPLPLDDEVGDTPLAVIPESLVPYWNGEPAPFRTLRESADDESDNTDSASDTEDTSPQSPKPSKQPLTDKRKHVATGKRPSGRPKKR